MAISKTKIGRRKLAKCHSGSSGKDVIIPAIVKIAVGTGGTSSREPKQLTGDETKLFNEVCRKSVVGVNQDEFTVRYTISLDAIKDKLTGKDINEVAIFDSEDDMIAIKTFKDRPMEDGAMIEIYFDACY